MFVPVLTIASQLHLAIPSPLSTAIYSWVYLAGFSSETASIRAQSSDCKRQCQACGSKCSETNHVHSTIQSRQGLSLVLRTLNFWNPVLCPFCACNPSQRLLWPKLKSPWRGQSHVWGNGPKLVPSEPDAPCCHELQKVNRPDRAQQVCNRHSKYH